MADEYERRAPGIEIPFQPFDCGKIQMVVGSSSKRISGEAASTRASHVRRASPPERSGRVFLPGEPELIQQITGKMGLIVGPRPD